MDNDTVSLPITSFQSTLKHILYTAASSGTTSGSSHAARSQTLHLALHCRQQQHLLGWEIGVRACDSSRSGTGKFRMSRLDESLISPESFPETQLLHWLCGKRHCHGGAEFLAILSLAASPEFFRVLGGAKLLHTISLLLSSDPLAQQLPDDHSLRRKWPPFSSQHSFASWLGACSSGKTQTDDWRFVSRSKWYIQVSSSVTMSEPGGSPRCWISSEFQYTIPPLCI